MEPPQPKPAPPELADLPILERRSDVPDLAAVGDARFVPPPTPADLAVGLADAVEPEEQLPLELSDGAAIVPVVPELVELPILERRVDVPNLLARVDVALPAAVKLEEEQPVELSPDVAPEPELPELAELPILERRLDLPNLLTMSHVPDAVQPDIVAEPALAELANLPLLELRSDLPNLFLSLNPLATQRELPVEIPAAEARGRFTISPKGSLDTSETEPGSPSADKSGDPAIGPGDENPGTDSFASTVTISFGSGGDGKGTNTSGGGGRALDRDQRRDRGPARAPVREPAPAPEWEQAPAPVAGLLPALRSSVESGGRPGLPATTRTRGRGKRLLAGSQSWVELGAT